ncbi:chromate transporter [Alteromonadaceae bacterium Bs31]|nr:chromate transporter [Alteromonadaceae bacterium Bs31]
MFEVFKVFLKLGCTSFGGPIAHLGYFHAEFVEKRKWLSESQYAQLLAICQFLPGPASSQLGFAIGLSRAGWLGAIAAFVAFTLPSAVLLVLFAAFVHVLSGELGQALIHGLKIVALVIVAHGVLGMIRQLCPDHYRKSIAVLAAIILLLLGSASMQIVVVVLGGIAGLFLCKDALVSKDSELPIAHGPRLGWLFIALFFAGLLLLPFLADSDGGVMQLVDIFYRAGALVFGGGHVVLPLLEEGLVASSLVSADDFLAGYGATQAVPGPMFAFSAYLGQIMGGPMYAVLACLSVFLPGFLLLCGVLPLWKLIARGLYAPRVIAGVNAAVVGLLGAALYDPIFISAVKAPSDLAIALLGFSLIAVWKRSPLTVVAVCTLSSVSLALLT